MHQYHFPCNKLSLEITESGKFDFSQANLSRLQRLREKGVQIALDDFGTGYSSFDNLMRLPAQVLKTEKSFIDTLEQDSYHQYLMRMMVDLAHTAGMKLVAEGVERAGQAELLMAYGTDYVQGYFYSRPLSEAGLQKMLGKFADAP